MKKVSVVIPTRNRAADLDELLSAIVGQTLSQDNYEVIVFDNGSSDNTADVCTEFATKIKNFVYEYDENIGLHVGRNWGYQHSSSEIIVYADDDIIPCSTWLEGMVEAFEDDTVMLVGGNNEPLFLKQEPEWLNEFVQFSDGKKTKIISLLSCVIFDYDCISRVSPYYIMGCNFGVRKALLTECKGFHPDGVPDNLLRYRGDGESYVCGYALQHNYKAVISPKCRVKHKVGENRTEVKYVEKIAYRCGISDAYTLLRKPRGWCELFLVIVKCIVKNQVQKKGMRRKYNWAYLHGLIYLFANYLYRHDCREWIHQEHYLGKYGFIRA
ncbi:glycosyltransferase family 2 protein [Butyrivibrio sp. XBB1001]|uniref:glycosyltransferase family 2 protein n=1 Tax=Butyrivibrio sp. XBB1001 TaxID=1280682 RepID=UPI000404F047|nr:glycosyltransferase family 2 protein [Butyrivibrio sp. XBB1001]